MYRGLAIGPDYDARLDLFEATRVALDLLEHNYRIDRNWLRTIAAYNAGLAKVRSAVRKNVTAKLGLSFWDLSLPAETRIYVARLLAAAAIVRDPASRGFTLPPVAATSRLVLLRSAGSGRVLLADFATNIGWTASEAARVNPHLGPVIDPSQPQRTLLVPAELAGAAARWLSRARPVRATVKAGADWQPGGRPIKHHISKGETLISIARRYGTTVSALRAANGLVGSKIRYGRTLNVPLPQPPLAVPDELEAPTARLDMIAG